MLNFLKSLIGSNEIEERSLTSVYGLTSPTQEALHKQKVKLELAKKMLGNKYLNVSIIGYQEKQPDVEKVTSIKAYKRNKKLN